MAGELHGNAQALIQRLSDELAELAYQTKANGFLVQALLALTAKNGDHSSIDAIRHTANRTYGPDSGTPDLRSLRIIEETLARHKAEVIPFKRR